VPLPTAAKHSLNGQLTLHGIKRRLIFSLANLVSMAFDGIRLMFDNYFAALVMQGTFSIYIAALVSLAQNRHFEKIG